MSTFAAQLKFIAKLRAQFVLRATSKKKFPCELSACYFLGRRDDETFSARLESSFIDRSGLSGAHDYVLFDFR